MCKNKIGNFECVCYEGFIGVVCVLVIDYCFFLFCRNNVICMNNFYGYYCRCVSGYMG